MFGVSEKHEFHVFVKTGLVYDCQKSLRFLCRKMTVGYLQVQTPLACVHFIQTAKIIHGNDSQSLLLLMPGHKKPYRFWFGGDLFVIMLQSQFFTKKYLLSFHLQQFTRCVPVSSPYLSLP